jgi:hypothetical protein
MLHLTQANRLIAAAASPPFGPTSYYLDARSGRFTSLATLAR